MKTIKILFAFLLTIASVVNAQEPFKSLLADGMEWTMRYQSVLPNMQDNPYCYEKLMLQGDILINGINFRKEYTQISYSENGFNNDWTPNGHLLGQKEGKLYEYDSVTKRTRIVMDFSMNKGDEIALTDFSTIDPLSITFEVVAVSDTTFCSSTDKSVRRCLYVQSKESASFQDVWVEGIGSLNYGIGGPIYGAVPNNQESILWLCTRADDVLYSAGEYEKTSLRLTEEGRTWHTVSLHPADVPAPGTEDQYYKDLKGRWCVGLKNEYVLNGDTIVNGLSYKKVIGTQQNNFICGLRQESSRVYAVSEWWPSEYLLFDFGLQPGDIFTVPYDDQTKLRVDKVDTVLVDGKKCRRLAMWLYEEGMEVVDGLIDIWIEGIGCLSGPNYIMSPTETGMSLLLDCIQDGKVLISMNEVLSGIIPDDGDYHPFLKDGKTWNCRLVEPVDENNNGYWLTTDYSLVLSGDTVVGDKTYKKMYKKPTMMVREYYKPAELAGKKDTLQVTGESTLWPELWREEGRKVYVCFEGTELLRYDFSSLTPGQTVDICGIPTGILSIDTISLFEKDFRCFHVGLQEYPDSYDRVWIEGVGHPDGPFRVWGAEVNDGRHYLLLSCYEDGECIYSIEEYEKWKQSLGIAPQPVAHPSIRLHDGSLFDLQGRKVQGQPARGIYIKDGKKVTIQ